MPKEKIAAIGDYNLSGERYRESGASNASFPRVRLGDVCERIMDGTHFSPKSTERGEFRYITAKNIKEWGVALNDVTYLSKADHDEIYRRCPVKKGDVLYIKDGATTGVATINPLEEEFSLLSSVAVLRGKEGVLDNRFLVNYLNSPIGKRHMLGMVAGVAITRLTLTKLNDAEIPLPPLEVQKEIVAEIEGYQKVINGARAVLVNYRPHIPIHPDWPMVGLEEVCEVKSGGTPSRSEDSYWNGNIPWVGSTVCKDGEVTKVEEFITEAGMNNSAAKLFPKDTTLIALVGATIGKTGLLKFESTTNQNIAGLYPKSRKVLEPIYLFHAAQLLYPEFMKLGEGKFRMANLSFVREQKISLPPLATQRAIVAEIEVEQALVAANRELIARFENKIQTTLARIWGEDAPSEHVTDDEHEAS